jgi:hypothetical protein
MHWPELDVLVLVERACHLLGSVLPRLRGIHFPRCERLIGHANLQRAKGFAENHPGKASNHTQRQP